MVVVGWWDAGIFSGASIALLVGFLILLSSSEYYRTMGGKRYMSTVFRVFRYLTTLAGRNTLHYRLWFMFVPHKLYNEFRSIVLWHVALLLQKWHGSLSEYILNHKSTMHTKLTNFMMGAALKYLGFLQNLLKRWNCWVVGYIGCLVIMQPYFPMADMYFLREQVEFAFED